MNYTVKLTCQNFTFIEIRTGFVLNTLNTIILKRLNVILYIYYYVRVSGI